MSNCTELMLRRVAAVVVLYRPDCDVIENILSYLEQVDLVVLVDNSEDPATDLIDTFRGNLKVISVVNGCNLGVAAALNIGANVAISRGADFLLTMDQDSCATAGMVNILRSFFDWDHLIAIVSPYHLTTIANYPDSFLPDFTEMETVWTSGNLLRLSAYKDVGPFNASLFIDFVDHEFCLRLKKIGYRVIQSNRAILKHNIGNNLKKIDFFSVSLVVSNHSPLRRYYITRNRFHVTKEFADFKSFCRIDKRRFLAECMTILLFESQKIKKIKMIISGYIDYRLGRMGKYKDE